MWKKWIAAGFPCFLSKETLKVEDDPKKVERVCYKKVTEYSMDSNGAKTEKEIQEAKRKERMQEP